MSILKYLLPFLLAGVFPFGISLAQNKVIKLCEGPVPGSETWD